MVGQAEKTHSLLHLLYSWYKQEVYQRREHMMRLTGGTCALEVVILLILFTLPPAFRADPGSATCLGLGVGLLTALAIMLVDQQRNRHAQAKQALIEIEQELGLYQGEGFSRERPLYPEHWKTDWLRDRSVLLYFTALGFAGLLDIAAILTRL